MSSPIDRLPNELVCKIAFYASPLINIGPKEFVSLPPWQVGHICRTWRSIVIADQSLWTSLVYSRMLAVDDEVEHLETLHERSGGALLDVAILDLPLWKDDDIDEARHAHPFDATPADAAFIAHSHRWRSLRVYSNSIYNEDAAIFPNILLPVRGRVSQLRRIEMSCEHLFSDAFRSPFNAFREAPALREVVLTKGTEERAPRLNIPLGQLTVYHTCLRVAEVERILRAVRVRIRDLKLEIPDIRSGPPPGPITFAGEGIHFPRLQRLDLRYQENIAGVLTHIRTPALRTLCVGPELWDPPLLDFLHLRPPSLHLTTLILSYYHIHTDGPPQSASVQPYIDVLRALPPTLKTLISMAELDEQHDRSAVFSALTGATPRLTRLALSKSHFDTRVEEEKDENEAEDGADDADGLGDVVPSFLTMLRSRAAFLCKLWIVHHFDHPASLRATSDIARTAMQDPALAQLEVEIHIDVNAEFLVQELTEPA
ncbi:F-box domain-containing protein [Mycena kentingensis (nom. inval.)]|nr:F-box domain-containing protein [Mycena kentingensis (nom. inval.)]